MRRYRVLASTEKSWRLIHPVGSKGGGVNAAPAEAPKNCSRHDKTKPAESRTGSDTMLRDNAGAFHQQPGPEVEALSGPPMWRSSTGQPGTGRHWIGCQWLNESHSARGRGWGRYVAWVGAAAGAREVGRNSVCENRCNGAGSLSHTLSSRVWEMHPFCQMSSCSSPVFQFLRGLARTWLWVEFFFFWRGGAIVAGILTASICLSGKPFLYSSGLRGRGGGKGWGEVGDLFARASSYTAVPITTSTLF